jgi:hypothetical protein
MYLPEETGIAETSKGVVAVKYRLKTKNIKSV